ncbi:DUF4342 domain-containing protein [Alkaliphilus crotonatoxidans]
MTNQLEQIDLLRKRANVGYEEAKQALEQAQGSLVDALVYLEKQNKIKSEATVQGAGVIDQGLVTIKRWVKKGNRSRFIIRKKDEEIINLSVTVTVIASIVAPVIPMVGIPLALITNHRIKIMKPNGEEAGVNRMIEKVSDKVVSLTKEVEVE